jgi:photosystem II stability/assembly factor-like uncharacterized protein
MRTPHVKHIAPLVLLGALLLTGCALAVTPTPVVLTAVPTAAEQQRRWETVLQTKVTQPVRMAAFLDETFGLTGGADSAGRAHVTTDGGQSWTMAESSRGCLFALDVVDADTIWQCNASDVSRSTDGGQTWSGKSTGRGQPFCRMSAADDETAWHLSPASLHATADGGATWAQIALPGDVSPENVAAVSLRTARGGYLLDYDGNLYTTADGGESWTAQTLDLAKYGETKLMPLGGTGASVAMRFLDADQAIIAMSLLGGGDSRLVALRTFDGGQTWQEETIPTEIGALHLTHDGKLLTAHSFLNVGTITVLEYR